MAQPRTYRIWPKLFSFSNHVQNPKFSANSCQMQLLPIVILDIGRCTRTTPQVYQIGLSLDDLKQILSSNSARAINTLKETFITCSRCSVAVSTTDFPLFLKFHLKRQKDGPHHFGRLQLQFKTLKCNSHDFNNGAHHDTKYGFMPQTVSKQLCY